MRSNHPLKIALYDPSGVGGICHYTFQLAESLTKSGCDVTVITTEGYELESVPRNFKLWVLFKRSWLKGWLVKFMPQIRNASSNHGNEMGQLNSLRTPKESRKPPIIDLLRALRLRITLTRAAFHLLWNRPHLIHFQWLSDGDADCSFIKLLKSFGFKIVYTAHDVLPQDEDTVENRRFFEKLYQLVDRLIVHAANNKREMIEIFGIDPNKIYVIPHGSNRFFYSNGSSSRESARRALGIPENKKVILFFGLIKPYKGLEYLVEAFREVKNRVANAVLLIAGKIHDEDSEEFKRYSHLIEQLRDRDDVMCINQYVAFDKVWSYFSSSDLVVLPYTKTYQSGVLLSAYAAGRPVVVTETGGLCEIVIAGKSGLVVRPGDASGLADAICEIITSERKIEEMGGYAKYLGDTIYSWENVALKTIDVYQSFLIAPKLH